MSLIVFQGEFAVGNLSSLGSHILKTTIPSSCIVLGMYNEQTKIGALAHIDDYTSPLDVIQKICNTAKKQFNSPCSSSYDATVLGGTQEPVSLKHKKLVLEGLKKYGMTPKIKKLPSVLSLRPQIKLNLRNGELQLSKGKMIDQRLEYLQRREYKEWNNWLDFKYKGVAGKDIPYFEGKIATRYEKDIPKFPAGNEAELAETRIRELLGKLQLPILYERNPLTEQDEL